MKSVNKSMMKYSIDAFDGSSWIDVTERKAIIYGAGKGCIDMMNDLLLPNVGLLVDGNPKIHGKQIMLLNKVYEVQTPNVLKNMNNSKYFIVVSSERYYKDIYDDISRICGSDFIVCMWKRDLRYRYKSLESLLLLDNSSRKKIANAGLSKESYEIMEDFDKLLRQMKDIPMIDRYIPLRMGGSKFSFLFGNNETLWVYHHNGYVNSFDNRLIERESVQCKLAREEAVDQYDLDKTLTLCKNKYFSCIQIYADEVLDFSNELVQKKVLKKMRELHTLRDDSLPINRFTDLFFWDYFKALEEKGQCIELVRNKIGVGSAEYIEKHQKNLCVIHGDLTYENVVSNNGDICFIDWEYLSSGLPEVDIGYFLFSIYYFDYYYGLIDFASMCNRCYEQIPGFMRLYYEKQLEYDTHLQTVISVVDLCILRVVMLYCLSNLEEGDKRLKAFLRSREAFLEKPDHWFFQKETK